MQNSNLVSRALYFTQSPQVLSDLEGIYLAPNISFKLGDGFGYYKQDIDSKGLYIVITGKDYNGSFSGEEFTNLLIENQYDIIAISAKYYHFSISDIRDILDGIYQENNEIKVEGIIIGAHGTVSGRNHDTYSIMKLLTLSVSISWKPPQNRTCGFPAYGSSMKHSLIKLFTDLLIIQFRLIFIILCNLRVLLDKF